MYFAMPVIKLCYSLCLKTGRLCGAFDQQRYREIQVKIIHPIIYKSILITSVLLLGSSTYAGEEQENVISKLEREHEDWTMQLLAKIQARPDAKMIKFESDGCSGGLSAGWNSFAKVFPAFKKDYGDRPPWEYCCVTHDKDYWMGETENGYEKRLKSDLVLKQCVIDWGKVNSEQVAKKLNKSAKKIEAQVNITAELMFNVIRVGGKPCSFLPWRWGYGWPHCSIKQQFE